MAGDNNRHYPSSSYPKTPPRSQLKRHPSSISRSSPFRTPPRNNRMRSVSVSGSGSGHNNKSAMASIRMSMSPSPTISRYPSSSLHAHAPYSSPSCGSGGRGGGGGGDRFIPSRRSLLHTDLCRKKLLTGGGGGGGDHHDYYYYDDGTGRRTDTPDNTTTRNDATGGGNSSSNGGNNSNSSINNGGGNNSGNDKAQTPAETPVQKEYKRRMLSSLCNVPLDALDEDAQPRRILNFGGGEATSSASASSSAFNTTAAAATTTTTIPTKENGYRSSPWRNTRVRLEDPYHHDSLRVLQHFESIDDRFSSAIRSADVIHRKIPSQPCRILDAPDLVDDYYLNLISWSADNILAVALAHCVYLWNAGSGEIHHLTTIEGDDDYVTSVSWCTISGQSKYLAIGTNSHRVQLWDTQASRLVRTLRGHSGRVASMAWNPNQHWLSSGGRDSMILQHDVRSGNHVVARYKAHEQEVCGLKWNEDGTNLASGGNENYLCIWDASMTSRSRSNNNNNNSNIFSSSDVSPRLVLKQHKAAVKALDWCPFNRGLLASGGGTADRSIKLWNSNSGAMLKSIDTGSQVCSILWSKHQRELCSSHGFSENQLILWKYGSRSNLTKVKELTGHTHRILSLACSPDGSTVVSAAADESLRFWNIFGSAPSRRSSVLPMGDLAFGMPTIR